MSRRSHSAHSVLLLSSSLSSSPSSSSSSTFSSSPSFPPCSFSPTRYCLLSCLLILLCLPSILCTPPPPSPSSSLHAQLSKGGGGAPASLSDTSKSFISRLFTTIPRINQRGQTGAPSKLPSNFTSTSEAMPYFWGVALTPLAVAAFLILLTLLVWFFFFCIPRCCCNVAGKRHATEPYEPRQVKHLRIAFVLFIICITTLTFLTLAASMAISKGIDDSIQAADGVVEYGYQSHDILQDVHDRALATHAQVVALNATIDENLPTAAEVTQDITCINTAYTVFQGQTTLTSQLSTINTLMSATPNLTIVDINLASLSNSITTLPNLTSLRQACITYNQSLTTTLPNLSTTSQMFDNMSTSLTTLSRISNVQSSITTWNSLTSSLQTQIPPLIASTTQMENAIVSMPNLVSLHANITDHTRTTPNMMLASLKQLNTSIAALPDATMSASRITSFNTTLMQLIGSMSGMTDVLAVQQEVNNVQQQSASWKATLTQLRTALASPSLNASSLLVQLTPAAQSLSSLPNLTSLVVALTQAQAVADNLRGEALPNLINTLLTFNTSVTSLTCITPLLDQLIRINATLAIFAPSLSNLILTQRTNINAYMIQRPYFYSNMTAGINAARQLSTSISSLSWNGITSNLSSAAADVATLPNMTKSLNDVRTLQNSLQSLPNMTAAISALDSLTAALNQLSMSSFITQMTQLNTTLHAFPSLTPYLKLVRDMDKATTDIKTPLTAAINYINGNAAAYGASGFPESSPSIRTPLLSSVFALNEVVSSRPSLPVLIAALNGLSAAISAIPNTATLTAQLTDVQNAVNGFPDITSLRQPIDDTRTSQTVLSSLITSPALTTLPKTLSSLPNITSTRTNLRTIDNYKATSSIPSIMDTLRTLDPNSFTSADRDTLVSNLQQLGTYRSQIPNLGSTLSSFTSNLRSLSDALDTMYDYRHEYYVNRDYVVKNKNRIDDIRAMIMIIVILAPLAFMACGIYAWIRKKGGGSMCMSIGLVSVMVAMLLISALLMIPALALTDNCSSVDQTVKEQMGTRVLNVTASVSWLESKPVFYADAYMYFSQCQGDKPEVFSELAHPSTFLARHNLNFTKYKSDLTSAVTVVTIHPNIITTLDSIKTSIDALDIPGSRFYNYTDCTETQAVLNPFKSSVCTNLLNPVALTACLLFLTAFCLCPGLICGIQGYKKFDQRNWMELDPLLDPAEARAQAAQQRKIAKQRLYEHHAGEQGAPQPKRPQQRPPALSISGAAGSSLPYGAIPSTPSHDVSSTPHELRRLRSDSDASNYSEYASPANGAIHGGSGRPAYLTVPPSPSAASTFPNGSPSHGPQTPSHHGLSSPMIRQALASDQPSPSMSGLSVSQDEMDDRRLSQLGTPVGGAASASASSATMVPLRFGFSALAGHEEVDESGFVTQRTARRAAETEIEPGSPPNNKRIAEGEGEED